MFITTTTNHPARHTFLNLTIIRQLRDRFDTNVENCRPARSLGCFASSELPSTDLRLRYRDLIEIAVLAPVPWCSAVHKVRFNDAIYYSPLTRQIGFRQTLWNELNVSHRRIRIINYFTAIRQAHLQCRPNLKRFAPKLRRYRIEEVFKNKRL